MEWCTMIEIRAVHFYSIFLFHTVRCGSVRVETCCDTLNQDKTYKSVNKIRFQTYDEIICVSLVYNEWVRILKNRQNIVAPLEKRAAVSTLVWKITVTGKQNTFILFTLHTIWLPVVFISHENELDCMNRKWNKDERS